MSKLNDADVTIFVKPHVTGAYQSDTIFFSKYAVKEKLQPLIKYHNKTRNTNYEIKELGQTLKNFGIEV